MSFKLQRKTFDKFGREWVKELTKQLIRAGKKNTGTLIGSLDYRIKEDANGILLQLEAEDYLTWVDAGRKRGTYPPIKAIAEWTRVKGIDQKAIFPIARSIFKFGIKPTNVLSKTENNILNNLSEMENELVNNIEDIVYENFKKLEK